MEIVATRVMFATLATVVGAWTKATPTTPRGTLWVMPTQGAWRNA